MVGSNNLPDVKSIALLPIFQRAFRQSSPVGKSTPECTRTRKGKIHMIRSLKKLSETNKQKEMETHNRFSAINNIILKGLKLSLGFMSTNS